tara:strand:- start:49 stop:774 length:726 start_codon:yes stop_codon:yes gene_type:complete
MPDPQMPVSLGGYGENQPAPGVNTTNFSVRTPDQGISFGRFGGETPLLNFTGNYGASTTEVTPGSMGIPQEAIDYFRYQNQKKEQSSFNVGIKALFPDGVVPAFMDRVLRPKSASVSYGRSESSFRNIVGDTSTNSDRRRGIGGQGQVLRGMFEDNAPTFGVQYFEPNKFDREVSGNVSVPLGEGNLNLSLKKYINEGRDNENSFKAGVNYPVGPGTISAEGQRTADGENRGTVRYTIPLN